MKKLPLLLGTFLISACGTAIAETRSTFGTAATVARSCKIMSVNSASFGIYDSTSQNSCSIAAGTTFNWTVGSSSCTFTQPAFTAIATGDNFPVTDSTAPATGAATFACSATGVLATTPNAGATCSVTSTGNYTVVADSCAFRYHQVHPTLDDQARAACTGAAIGQVVTNIHHFPFPRVGCYTDVMCQ